MFSIEFTKCLKKTPLIWSIDECTISRSTKYNYSWSIKGINKEIKNSPFSGSINIILAIMSNGCWFLLATNKTINSDVFWHFIQKLNFWINDQNKFGYDEIIWIMDNCPSHKSKITYSILSQTNFQIRYIPAYSPDLSPVELSFAFIKRKLSSNWKSLNINLKSKQSKNELLQVLKMMKKKHIIGFFQKYLNTLKKYLNLYN